MQECCTDPNVDPTYAQISCYDRTARREGPLFSSVGKVNSNDPIEIARMCHATPGCVGFTSTGELFDAYRNDYMWREANKDFYVRRCSVPAPWYIELYTEPNYGGLRWLIPHGKYENLFSGTFPATVIGPTTYNSLAHPCGSIKIPMGVSVVLFPGLADVSGAYVQLAGYWPNFNAQIKSKGKYLIINSMETREDFRFTNSSQNDVIYSNSPRVIMGMFYN
jgi:hypothetical protein